MLRDPNRQWWRRPGQPALVPVLIGREAPVAARRCPECSAAYDVRDRYCPSCHAATPEWRYG